MTRVTTVHAWVNVCCVQDGREGYWAPGAHVDGFRFGPNANGLSVLLFLKDNGQPLRKVILASFRKREMTLWIGGFSSRRYTKELTFPRGDPAAKVAQ